MGFDDEIDQLKKELQTPALGNEGVKSATERLLAKLKEKIQSKRLTFALGASETPVIDITYVQSGEKLATIHVNDDSSISFHSTFGADQGDYPQSDSLYLVYTILGHSPRSAIACDFC